MTDNKMYGTIISGLGWVVGLRSTVRLWDLDIYIYILFSCFKYCSAAKTNEMVQPNVKNNFISSINFGKIIIMRSVKTTNRKKK